MATRDPEATKQRILGAALHEFSAKGISGARVDAIAARAKVNKRMLYYYFGSKDGLFREILRRRIDESTAALQARDVASDDRLANGTRNVARDTEYIRLLAWEALEMRPHQPVNESIRRRYFSQWIDAIVIEQEAGRLPADLDPGQLVLSEVCLVLGPMLIPQITRLVTGRTLSDADLLDRRCEFLTALTRHLSPRD
ncbi:MAG TPA: TetR/AcrR family transcriptional regulator [Acidimicrobiia bacterium]|nr:TetR/AcrR family transcriptional regulator [Acidimicrobiia bacterium]